MNLQPPRILIFRDTITKGDKLQAKGRLVKLSELPPEEQERRRNMQVYNIPLEGTVDEHIPKLVARKRRVPPDTR